jgi:hypothetical protein
VCLYFLIIFFIFIFLRKRNLFETKIYFFGWSMIVSMVFIAMFKAVLSFFDSVNLERIMTYAEGSGENNLRLLIVMSVFLVTVFASDLFFKNDSLNKLIIFVTTIVTTMTIAFPFADSIFSRLAYFSVPLVGIYFVRWFLFNFPRRWLIMAIVFIFISGAVRIIPLVVEKKASVQFLAKGHPLDPFMGMLKMIFFLNS